MRIWSFWSILSALLAIPALAVGSSSEKPATKLSWVRAESALDCLSPVALESELVERMGRNPFEGTPGQWIEGYVVRTAERFEVELFERAQNGETIGARKFVEVSESCRSLDDAIELAIALIIDPQVRLAERSIARRQATSPVQAEPPQALPPAVAATVSPAPGARGPLGPAAIANVAVAPTARLHAAPTQGKSNAAHDAALSAAAFLVGGLLPVVAPGVEMGARLGARSWATRLAMTLVPEQRPNSEFGDFGFGATLFNLSGCLNLGTSRLKWLNCLELGAGAIHVTVHRPLPLEPGDRFFGFTGVESGLSLQIVEPLWLDTRLFGLVPVSRWDFRLVDLETNGSRRIFLQHGFMPGAAIGLSARIF